jgi:regulator of sigma D
MLLEEFYNYDASDDKLIAEYVYVHTLSCWIVNGDFDIYESLIDHYEKEEQYAVCEGIHKALSKIDDIMAVRFDEADKIQETEDKVVYSMQEHNRVSALIFEDILKEIYEKQINKYKTNN